MKARKILAVSLTAAMTLALAACGGSSSDKESSSKDSSDKVYKIGICQQLEHAALDEATKGFEEACEEKFGKDKVKFDLQNGQGEQANCATIVNNFVADNDDLILANATTALQCAAAATSTIPILGTSVTDYATALDISDWTGCVGTFFIPLTVVNVYRNGIQGMGYGLLPMMAGVAELVGRGVVAMIAAGQKSYFGVCMASPAAWILASALLIVMYYYVIRQNEKRFAKYADEE